MVTTGHATGLEKTLLVRREGKGYSGRQTLRGMIGSGRLQGLILNSSKMPLKRNEESRKDISVFPLHELLGIKCILHGKRNISMLKDGKYCVNTLEKKPVAKEIISINTRPISFHFDHIIKKTRLDKPGDHLRIRPEKY